jgi:hypothetical protein
MNSPASLNTGFARVDWTKGRYPQHGPGVPFLYVCFGLPFSALEIWLLAFHQQRVLSLLHSSGDGLSAFSVLLGFVFTLTALLFGPIPLLTGSARLLRLLLWGRSELVVATVPKLGQRLDGRVYIPANVSAMTEARVTLSCRGVRERRAYHLNGQTGTLAYTSAYFDRIAWATTETIRAELVDGETWLPVHIAIPRELPPSSSSEDEPKAGTFWVLQVVIDRPLLRFKARITIPVIAAS